MEREKKTVLWGANIVHVQRDSRDAKTGSVSKMQKQREVRGENWRQKMEAQENRLYGEIILRSKCGFICI